MNDRYNEFDIYNYSLCEKDCEFRGYDNETKKAKCECKIKKELKIFSKIIVDTDLLFNNFIKLNSTMNIDIIKCYYIVFTYDGLIKNIGSYIMLTIILIFLITVILFFTVGYNKLFIKMTQISSVKFYEHEKIQENARKKNTKINTKRVNHLNISGSSNSSSISKSKNNLNSNLNENNIIKSPEEVEQEIKLNNQRKRIMKAIDSEMNSLPYDKALKIDKRTFFQYYFSLLKAKHLLVFSFYPSDDYNLMTIKMYLFFFAFSLYYTVNALFFTDKTMHKIYEDKGTFNFIYQIPQIIYSTIISTIFTTIVQSLALTEKNILDIKQENKGEKVAKAFTSALQCTLIKYILFTFFNMIFLGAFWYYLACFCAVYKNTQIHLITDTLISFGTSLIYPLGINLIPGLFRIPALKSKNKEFMYKISKLIQLI